MTTAAIPTVRFQSATPQFTVSDVVKTAEYYRDVVLVFAQDTSGRSA
jgi:hypothetical protein